MADNQKVGFGTKIANGVKSYFKHWNHPKEGRYVSNKEVLAYSVGGMGMQFVAAVVAQVVLNSSCILLGSIYKMTPMELTILLTINTIFTLLIQPLKSYWIDNVGAHSEKQRGKARPFLLWMGFPSAILLSLIPFIPETWIHNQHMLVVAIVGVLFILMNFVYQFWFGMYTQLAQLISPNTTERADIVAISSIIYSFAPTLTGFFFPLIAGAFDEGWLDIRFYRIIFPVFSVVGVAISLLCYFGTKERIVVPKKYKAKVKFKDGMKQILTNKYFWIVTIPQFFFFARAAMTACMNWAYVYMLQDTTIQSFVTLIVGTASGIGMALAPLFIRLLGNKWTVILSNMMFTVSSIFLIFFNTNFWAIVIFSYLSFFGGAVQIITGPAMHAEALDYQQLKSGDRLEGFVGNFGILVQIVALGTNFIIPAIYVMNGLTDNYDVLFDPAVRTPIFRTLSILAALGGIACSIPYLWWDMTKEKHAGIIEELKKRAIEQNKADGEEGASFLSSDESVNDLWEGEVDKEGHSVVEEELAAEEAIEAEVSAPVEGNEDIVVEVANAPVDDSAEEAVEDEFKGTELGAKEEASEEVVVEEVTEEPVAEEKVEETPAEEKDEKEGK